MSGELTGTIQVFAHEHGCEGRWHSYAAVKYVLSSDEAAPRVASFHEWGRDAQEAAGKCCELVELFLRQNGVQGFNVVVPRDGEKVFGGPVA